MDKCRPLLFSDIHILPKSFYDPSGRKLDIILEAAKNKAGHSVDAIADSVHFSLL